MYKRDIQGKRKTAYAIFYFGAALLLAAYAFYKLHWPGYQYLFVAGAILYVIFQIAKNLSYSDSKTSTMKKLYTFNVILINIGFVGVLGSILFRIFHINDHGLFTVTDVCFLAGAILLPILFVKDVKLKKDRFWKKTFLIVFWSGILIIAMGSILQDLHWDGYRLLLKIGLPLFLLCALYLIINRIVTRLHPKGQPTTIEALAEFGLASNDLCQYTGVYANEKLPLKIKITQNGDALVAQAGRQPAFYLQITGKNTFKYFGKDIILEFDPVKSELLLKQHGKEIIFIKEV
jgi:hypothetical protein